MVIEKYHLLNFSLIVPSDAAKAEPFICAKTWFFNDAKTDFLNFAKLNILMSQEKSV